MGPRAFTRGDASARSTASLRSRSFNGATRIHAWRQVGPGIRVLARPPLQWGHAHSRVETS